MGDGSRPKVAGVILAAGASTRMGRPKQLLPYLGRPLLEHALDAARGSALSPVILVLGANIEAIREAIDSTGVEIAVNDDYRRGQSTSVVAGVAALPEIVDGVLLLLGDQPGVTGSDIDSVLAAFDGDPRSIVMPSWQGTPANPVLFGRAYFADLQALSGDEGARQIVARRRECVTLVPIDRPIPPDVDTETDYQRLLEAID